MKVQGKLSVLDAIAGSFEEYTELPSDPKVGQWAKINETVMVCLSVGEHPVWVPITPERNTVIRPIDTASKVWTVEHNFAQENVFVQCFDEDKKVVHPSEVSPIDANTTEITFPQEVKGTAIVMFGFTGSVTPKSYVGGDSYEPYQGTDPKNLDYPIGSIQAAWATNPPRNAITELWLNTTSDAAMWTTFYGHMPYRGAKLEGKWACRYRIGSLGNVQTWAFERIE